MNCDHDLLAAATSKAPQCGSFPEPESHAAQCAPCSAELSLFETFLAAQPTPGEARDVQRIERALRGRPAWGAKHRPGVAWFPRFLALAGVAAALMFALLIRQQNPISSSPDLGVDDIMRSGQVSGIAPVGDLSHRPGGMRWDPVAGAAVYRVRLTEVDRNVVWQTLASEAGIRLPEEARAFMRDRKTLFWEITALDADGRVIASCEPEPFRVLERKP